MAMGKRKRERQEPLFLVASELPRTPAHPFYRKLNEVLAGWEFEERVEGPCGGFYHDSLGRPSLAPGVYFRLLPVGYFEGIDSERGIAERGIARRVADSLSPRAFVGYGIGEAVADHSTLSRTRRPIDLETHQQVFTRTRRACGRTWRSRAAPTSGSGTGRASRRPGRPCTPTAGGRRATAASG
jgi:transposase